MKLFRCRLGSHTSKLRGSWAQSGGAVGAYQLGLTYSYADAYRKYPVGSIDNGTIPNLNLKPLTSISYEGGFEARFFNNRFGIDFTYYVRNTKDDIVNQVYQPRQDMEMSK